MKNLLNLEILTKTMDDLPVGVGIFHIQDPNDLKSIQYVFMNKIILYEMRKKREEVFGRLILEVAPEAFEHEVGLQVIETYRNVAVNGKSVNLGMVEYSNEEVAGTYECSVHHIQDNYVYVMLRNVTELEESRKELAAVNKDLEKRVQERTVKLEKKNRELEHISYITSHDLQEPLRTISNYVQVLHEDFENTLNEEVLSYLEAISNSTNRMRSLISGLMSYSRLGKGKTLVEVSSEKIIGEVISDLQHLIQSTKAKIKISQLPKIHAYETELRLVFQNLIANALKFQKENQAPVIQINYTELENYYQFSISDNGIGMASKYIDRIFHIFQKLHSYKKYEGYGIGLAHCKKVVEIHEGEIWVESEIGNGSTFYFTVSKQLGLLQNN